METLKLYSKEQKQEQLTLSPEQRESINRLTLSLPEINESVLEMVVENNDVIKTLENGHPLNRLITNPEGKLSGYVACEDFVPTEAYIKYLGTDGSSGRNLLSELPAFFDYAKSQGYTKLNFHGWNERLNNILKRYGFERLRTDSLGEFSADFYEKVLQPQKTQEQVNAERIKAFENKFIQKVNQEYGKTLKTFKENEETITQKINQTTETISNRIKELQTELSDKNKLVLKLKLARHFQHNENVDTNVLVDAIIETPKFLESDKGSLHRLFEIHEEKTIQKIAEMRKRKAEQSGEGFNPYEALFTTESGDYYMARLLNMPHLEAESAYMNHCVGTSDSYISKIKRGDIEILSFRRTPTINKEENKLNNDDTPLITIEYNLKTKTIQQMKKYDDEYLQTNDPYYHDVLDALSQLRNTKTDMGEQRDFKSINSSELQNISVADYHMFTNKGEISIQDYNPNDPDVFVLKKGSMDIMQPGLSEQDIEKIIQIAIGQNIKYSEIAFGIEHITPETKMYIGPWNIDIYQKMPDTVEYLYESFPEKKIFKQSLELTPKTPEQYETELITKGNKLSSYSKDILQKMPPLETNESLKLVSFSVEQLGFPNGATVQEIYDKAREQGLDLCPPQVGPQLRINYIDQPSNEYLYIAMEPISGRGGNPTLFRVDRDDSEPWLSSSYGKPGSWYDARSQFVFVSRN